MMMYADFTSLYQTVKKYVRYPIENGTTSESQIMCNTTKRYEDFIEQKVSVFFNDTANPMWIILCLSLKCRLKLV